MSKISAIGSAALGLPVGEASYKKGAGGARRSDLLSEATDVLGTLRAAASSSRRSHDSATLKSAVEKLQNASSILYHADGIEDAMAELQKQQRKESSDKMRSAEGNSHDAFKKMDQLRKHQIELIKKREEAEKKKGFWASIGSFFSKIANVVSSVVKAVQVMASVTPLGLLSVAISVSKVAFKNEIDKLGPLAGALAEGVGGIADMGVSTAADLGVGGQTCLAGVASVGSAVDGAVYGIINQGIAEGVYHADALDTQADIEGVRVDRKKAMYQAQDAQDALREVAATQAKTAKLITNILSTHQRMAKSAIA